MRFPESNGQPQQSCEAAWPLAPWSAPKAAHPEYRRSSFQILAPRGGQYVRCGNTLRIHTVSSRTGFIAFVSRLFYRPIGAPPGTRAARINETIDDSVFERWRSDRIIGITNAPLPSFVLTMLGPKKLSSGHHLRSSGRTRQVDDFIAARSSSVSTAVVLNTKSHIGKSVLKFVFWCR